MKRGIGRPRIVESPEVFEVEAEAYFQRCAEEERPPTISGIALALGFVDRRSFYNYEEHPEFSHAIKKARARIEQHHEERMSGTAPTGSIFWLKNHGWADKQETDHRFPDGLPAVRVDWGDQ